MFRRSASSGQSFQGMMCEARSKSRSVISGQGAAALPVGQQTVAKDVLANALNDEALGLGGLRQVAGCGAEVFERGFGQRYAKGIDLGQHWVLPPSSVATPRLNASVSWPACVGERHK